MPVDLYSFIDMYDHVLDVLAHILAKGADHAAANGVTEAEMLDWRLIDDMRPLRFQAMVVCNFTRLWPAVVAGLPRPADISDEISLQAFHAAIADAKDWLAALTPALFEGRDDAPLTMPVGSVMEPTLPAGRWLTHFATTNIYFHLATAYGILRAHGVPLGKMDLFPSGL